MCGASSIATGANIFGTFTQMQAARDNASYQASIANQNAAIAEAQSVSVGQQGSNEQSQIREKARQATGSQKASFAANGLDVQAGSALDAISDTAYLSEQDVQTSRYNTAMQMWGLNNQANQYKTQAKNAIETGKKQATSALLNGITTAAKQYSVFGDNTTNSSNTSKINTGSNTNYSLVNTDANGDFFIGNNDYTIKKPGTAKYKRYF